ncbi:MAG: alanine--glyoxylate aminotransferase family protein [Planctomycetes bacterium]|nr:alanine--glyoxylate aminotransferase family protein [Planctomycetota bacterium]
MTTDVPHKRLFLPGPVEVAPEVRAAMSTPMIGHRMSECSDLIRRIRPKLQQALFTKNPVFLGTAAATGFQEACFRNLCAQRALSAVCGAFSERFALMGQANGKPTDTYAVEWGQPNTADVIGEKLASRKYDLFTMVHNETSTGVMNPVEEIARVMRDFPEVMFCVDAVSSLGGVKIEPDRLGIDVLFASVQKAFALPPGFTVLAVSERAIEKAKTVKDRGNYFDFVEMREYDKKDQTPFTPSIAHMFALDRQLDRMLKEGVENRFARHQAMQQRAHGWGREKFGLFAKPGYESVTLTVFRNQNRFEFKALNSHLSATRGLVIGDGYGKIKGSTFRIGHMGDATLGDLNEVLSGIDEFLAKH